MSKVWLAAYDPADGLLKPSVEDPTQAVADAAQASTEAKQATAAVAAIVADKQDRLPADEGKVVVLTATAGATTALEIDTDGDSLATTGAVATAVRAVMTVPDYGQGTDITLAYSDRFMVSNVEGAWIGHTFYTQTVPSAGYVFLRVDATKNDAGTNRIILRVNGYEAYKLDSARLIGGLLPVAAGDVVSGAIEGYAADGEWLMYASCMFYPPKFVIV